MEMYADTAQAKTDIEAIHELLGTYVDTWNQHDMEAWGALFTDDVDYVNRRTSWWQSNRQNVDGHKAIHAELEEQSQPMSYTATAAKISFLTPEIALAHVTWSWPGFNPPKESVPEDFSGIITMVMLKRGGMWLIRAVQNTVSG